MKRSLLLAAVFALCAPLTHAVDPIARSQGSASLRNEIQLAIDKGVAWLKSTQQADGSFANPESAQNAQDHPALTALPLTALMRDPSSKEGKLPVLIDRGLDYLRSQAQPDGGIYGKGLSNYNTSVSLVALLEGNRPQDEPLVEAARRFIAGQQATTMAKPELDGGFGYGPTGASPKRMHPDLDNTLITLEALRAYKEARPTTELAAGKDLNWQAAIDFVARCQNLTSNGQPWASDDPANKGGFLYYPGFSNAGEQELPDGKKALRSYGTMTYAGLLSFIYADVKRDDPRVVAALEWLQKHYTLAENPGLERQGYYYYLHLLTKGLAASGITRLKTADGREVDWAREVALKLIDLQAGNGSWVNDTARWMEKDPVLVTSYAVLALEILHRRM
jgi:squalene-hopene/tetraprenyl-beta-curcumene cyclase